MPTPQTLGRRVLRGLAILTLVFLGFYLVGANLVLNTDVLDWAINPMPERDLIEWQGGWTIFPGFVHVEGLRFRGQTLTEQWQFTLREADVRLNVFALPFMKVRASKVVGTDFSFRQRSRLMPETLDSPGAAHFPDIPGLSNPPDPKPEEIYHRDPKDGPKWSIQVSNIDIEGSLEVAINQFRLMGAGRAGGDFRYQIGGEMHLPHAYLDLEDSRISVEGTAFVEQVHLRTEGSLSPFEPLGSEDIRIFDHIYGQVALENGVIPNVDVVQDFAAPGSTLRLVGGSANFTWQFERSTAEAGADGSFRLEATGADVLLGARKVSADVTLDARLEEGDPSAGFWSIGATTLALDRVDLSLLPTAEPTSGEPSPPSSEQDLWWARVTIEQGTIDLGSDYDFDADVHFELKSTEPVVHFFLAKPTEEGGAKLPGWVKVLPKVRNIEGRGSVRTEDDGTRRHKVALTAKDYRLFASLETGGTSVDGGLFLQYRGSSLGVKVRDGRKSLRVLAPKRWFLQQEMFEEYWDVVSSKSPISKTPSSKSPEQRDEIDSNGHP